VIIITGVGRSGTSLVARLYRELGLDPGGAWDASINAGLEDPGVVRLNRAIMRDLGVGLPVDRNLEERPLVRVEGGGLEAREIARPDGGLLDSTAVRLPTRVVPGPLRRAVRRHGEQAAAAVRARVRGMVGRGRQLRAVRWETFGTVVERHGPAARELAAARAVAKDPRFAWTLGVWAAAGAPIDHVLVCVRDLGASVDSRLAAGHYPPTAREDAVNVLVYGLGLCFGALHDHRLEHAVVRFPEILDAPGELLEAMRLPESSRREDFHAAFARVVDRRLVHH
jgi:hypothetical protein